MKTYFITFTIVGSTPGNPLAPPFYFEVSFELKSAIMQEGRRPVDALTAAAKRLPPLSSHYCVSEARVTLAEHCHQEDKARRYERDSQTGQWSYQPVPF